MANIEVNRETEQDDPCQTCDRPICYGCPHAN